MNHRLRTSFAAVAVVASVSVASVASAHEGRGKGEGKGKGHGKAKVCKKKGKGYLVHGLLAGGTLERVAGGDTARLRDDRYSGTIVVEVRKGNRRGRRDVGLSSYAVTGVRVIGAGADGALPAAGTRVQLVGKQSKPCDGGPTPEPTTPEATTPEEPTATSLRRPGSQGGPNRGATSTPNLEDDVDEEVDDDVSGDSASNDDASDDNSRDDDESSDGESSDGEAGDDESATATAVTDVTVRVVHFKVRPKAARR